MEMDSILKQLDALNDKVGKMYYALMGNELSKDGGIIRRIDNAEKDIKAIKENDIKGIKDDILAIQKQNIKFGVYQSIMWAAIGGTIGLVFAYLLQIIFKPHP